RRLHFFFPFVFEYVAFQPFRTSRVTPI
uniref:Uncharacterized protein n=1 Tax=Caenorhabditis japonica TaxID=281687 RepID=A0A8R1IIZ3_CAEJA